ncbi:MAG: tRNA 2-thiocytidine(32) synthetase TtcA [Sulfurimonas sp. RIFCSPHIGHO2_12_FULL_36_9]|jgi:tRNA(Ile)-lysidine synthase TilS/MesJ|uniref:ATP-binding protein n=1 Tax=Sulfurimonas sp. RIFCSPLOWO2_12_36_12 TaxID=1802253 RepID=UPI0008D5C916|nr:ATP-binding protein [Sulfurimonas sp. RIFCSPLOWO2_12_36_12]OHD98690.1 MAG: tRNA 2-thiocytidine(32) synthetase TtcA [Sulfurimonas sp. RIFCSPHIGHO2_12_FULL_36_9]OHE00775.1 MAG: tRNA 2-thiocytidine(32) synthetase TtcA [Sulfurimonas sp. RIFCSPLOWO2_02_FULL_36_28]OHE02247.1 MAG: tRNA 2-thiocytidine(32) synthetase TtcA [Sulfurimonas sp. RIFCSPLOWO2_12_36_12]OHE04759.1 MAG: tRNA 2-thiocytidine(32) synthetase TtcA [Sulfurimonas sp. RIFCSPLOWO2_12_FULL_36_74]
MSKLGKTNAEFNLIEEGDKILVGLSGGKDSLTMVHALREQQRRAPFKFEFIAVTVSYGMGENFDKLIAHCKEYDIAHAVHDTQIYDLAGEKIRKNSSFCSFFSRMRRGSLYSVAEKYGCNKVALGHHMDDAAESFFMNFIYNGQMRSLAPKYRAENGLIVIRPLIQMRERQLAACAVDNSMPTIGDEACPSMRFDVKMPHARARTKEMLKNMEKEFPSLFTSLNAAFKNISEDSFFEKEKFNI